MKGYAGTLIHSVGTGITIVYMLVFVDHQLAQFCITLNTLR